MNKDEIREILKEAGKIMLSAKEIENAVTEKEGTANFVTKYDVMVQTLLKERLCRMHPEAHFVGEESEEKEDALHGTAFIVDPIDGTTNFIKHYDASAISVAMLQEGEVVMGATYNPYRDEFFYAEKHKGATCNGRKIHVANTNLSQSLVCFGSSPYYPELISETMEIAEKLLRNGLDLRRSGSAVIDLCDIARGRIGIMFEKKLSPWDYAASSLIITEAGGKITQMDGQPITYGQSCSVVAGTPEAYEDFFQL